MRVAPSGCRSWRSVRSSGHICASMARARSETVTKIDADKFRVRPGERHPVRRRPTAIDNLYASKDEFNTIFADHANRIGDLQEMLYASKERALLVIFQGMDTAGKDGTIRHVMAGVSPQSVQVWSFGKPSETELRHDFLWRETLCL